MRLFLAIKISEEIRWSLEQWLKELRPLASKAKWVRTENLHVTLKFLGEVPTETLAPLQEALAPIQASTALTLNFRGLGFFPGEMRPSILWLGIQSTATLSRLARDIDRTTHQLGFPAEGRPFTPHLTLARFQPPGLAPELQQAVSRNKNRDFGRLTTGEFQLLESKLRPSGAEYTTLQAFHCVPES